MRRHVFALTVGILLIAASVSQRPVRADSGTMYTVTDLGTYNGAVPTITGINAAGQVSGYADTTVGRRAVRYDPGTGWHTLNGLDGVTSAALAINAHGDLTGFEAASMGVRAFRYTDSGGVTLLPDLLPGGSFTIGQGIDDNGDVVGFGTASTGELGWFVSGGSTTLTILPTLPGGTLSMTCGINNFGAIAGWSITSGGEQHAYRINPDGSTDDIGSLDGPSGTSAACAIDDKGRVGGNSSINGSTHAFRFDTGAPVDIDSFGSSQSTVSAVAAGVSVGSYATASGDNHAFVQDGVDPSVDLNDRLSAANGWVLSDALAVNTNGAIAGDGLLNGATADFLLTPIKRDTTPPTITSLSATPSTITPPNGAMVAVTVTAVATDNVDASPVCSIDSITPSGSSSAVSSVTGTLTGSVSATAGATYAFNVTCSDASGNQAHGSVNVVVPPDTTAPVITSLSATPSTIAPPAGQMAAVTIAVSATDDSGAAPACDLSGISGPGTQGVDYAVTGQFTGTVKAVGGRSYSLTAHCIDGAGNGATASVSVVVPPDTTPPVISSVSATPSFIWPPDNKMVSVSVSVTATDNVDAAPACSLTSVAGPANPAITGQLSASVQASSGNVYVLTVTCRDAAGNTSSTTTSVAVTKDPSTSANSAKHRLIAAVNLLRDKDRDRGDRDDDHHGDRHDGHDRNDGEK